MTGDLVSPTALSNGKIVRVNTDPGVYHRTAGRRGDPNFIMSRSELTDFAACPHRWLAGVKRQKSAIWILIIIFTRSGILSRNYPGRQ